jgi:hypothetical protein
VGAIEFFEDAALCFLAHADAIVFDAYDQVFLRAVGNDADQKVFLGVFDSVVDGHFWRSAVVRSGRPYLPTADENSPSLPV